MEINLIIRYCIFKQKIMKRLLISLFGMKIAEKICRFHQREVQLFHSILGTSIKK